MRYALHGSVQQCAMDLLDWFKQQPRHVTIAACARAWGVSTLWLIAHKRVRASWDAGVIVERETRGAVTMAEVCGPLPDKPPRERSSDPRPRRKRSRPAHLIESVPDPDIIPPPSAAEPRQLTAPPSAAPFDCESVPLNPANAPAVPAPRGFGRRRRVAIGGSP